MNAIKISVALLALTMQICWGSIIVKHSEVNDSSQLLEAVVNILESCRGNDKKPVGMAGHVPENLYRRLPEKLIPVTLLGDYRSMAYKSEMGRWEMYKLDVFIMTASSRKQFDKVIWLIKGSKWWNPVAHYLIIDFSLTGNNGSTDHAQYLYKAWKNNMIHARVICQNSTGEVKLYGYNPYTDKAPELWHLERVYSKKKFHPFAVFSQDYNGVARCETVGAAAMKKLGGAKFYILYPQINLRNVKSSMLFALEHINFSSMLMSTLNATRVYNKVPENQLWFVYRRSKKYMTMWSYSIQVYKTFPSATFSYTFSFRQFYAISQFRGHLTQLEKILSVTDISSRIGLCLVLSLTILFFKYFIRLPIVASFLNVLRIVCNVGFTNIPNNLLTRLYLGPVLLFAVVMQGIYQGNLANLLTQTVPIRDPMTKQDLADLGYTVHVYKHRPLSFDEKNFGTRVVRLENQGCPKSVTDNPLAACVTIEHSAKDIAWNRKLHMVGESMGCISSVLFLPMDSHLEERINNILQKIWEADITLPLRFRGQDRKVSDFEYDEQVRANQSYKAISLAELEFAFVILGIGLVCATVTFIGELAAGRHRSRSRNKPNMMGRQDVRVVQNASKRRRSVKMKSTTRPRHILMKRNPMFVPSKSSVHDSSRSPSRLSQSRPRPDKGASFDRRRLRYLSSLRSAPLSATFIRLPDVVD